MLDLNTKLEMHGVTLYRDFDDQDVFYYMPGLPHIAIENGDPVFSLMAFEKSGEAGEDEAGGFMTLTVSTDLGHVKDKVLQSLKRRFGGNVRLTSVDFTDASVKLIGLDIGEGDAGETVPTDNGPAGIRFIEKVEATQTPMLSGDNRAFFSTRLSEEGTALMLAVLEGNPDAMPFGISYDFTFSGLLSVQDLKIEIDFERSYNFMRQRFGLNAVVVEAEVDNIVEELKTNEAIKIIDTVRTLELSTPEAMQARKNEIDSLVKELAKGSLFQPTLTVGKPTTNEEEAFGSSAENATGSPIERALRAGGPGAGILAGMSAAHRPELRTEAEDAEPGDEEAAPAPTDDEQESDAARIYREMGSPKATFVMRNLSQNERRTVTYDLSRTAVQQRKYPTINSLSFMAPLATLRRKVTRIDLNHPFFKRIDIDIDAAAMDFEAEGVTKLTVDFRYGERSDGTPKDEISVVLQQSTDKKSFTLFADESGTKQYEYRITAHYQPDFGVGDESLVVVGPWIKSDARLISAHSQMVSRRMAVSLRLPRVLPDDLLEVRSVVHYTNEDGTVEDSEEVILSATNTSKNVVVRYSNDDDMISVTAKAIFADGSEQELPTQKRPDPANGAADDVVEFFLKGRPSLDFDVIMQDPLDELASVILDYEVVQGDQIVSAKSMQMEQALSRRVISEALPDEVPPASLRVKERHLFSSGGIDEVDWRDVTDKSVITGVPAADVQTVAIRYVGPPMDAMGMSGILVDLEYEDPNGNEDFKQSETIFVNNHDVVDWRFRMADRNATTFKYRLTIFMDNGEERVGEFKEYSGNDLILRSKL